MSFITYIQNSLTSFIRSFFSFVCFSCSLFVVVVVINIQIVDVPKGRCDDAFAYIPDVEAYRVIVYSFKTDKSWQIKHNFFYSDPLDGDFNVGGVNFQVCFSAQISVRFLLLFEYFIFFSFLLNRLVGWWRIQFSSRKTTRQWVISSKESVQTETKRTT